jgi:hypothetical protein
MTRREKAHAEAKQALPPLLAREDPWREKLLTLSPFAKTPKQPGLHSSMPKRQNIPQASAGFIA